MKHRQTVGAGDQWPCSPGRPNSRRSDSTVCVSPSPRRAPRTLLPMPTPSERDHPYVSRGGIKLAAALDAFRLDPTGLVCADLGCSTGGFTDCLLQHGAARVYAVDTAYGELAWKLRQDPRVVVMERTNALHADAPEPVDLVTVDLGWTRQDKAVPTAMTWLRGEQPDAPPPRILTLIKPHYETTRGTHGRAMRAGRKGVLSAEDAAAVAAQTVAELPALGVVVEGHFSSPITGGKGGNIEYLALLRPAPHSGKAQEA